MGLALGLDDAHIARQRSDPDYQLGHRHGDGAYVLEPAREAGESD